MDWRGRFSLTEKLSSELSTGGKERKNGLLRATSKHQFFVKEPSQWRMHMSSLGSGVLLRFTLKNVEGEVLFTTDKAAEQIMEFDRILPLRGEDRTLSKDALFTLEIEYAKHPKKALDEFCPQVEIHFIVEPIRKHSAALACTGQERDDGKASDSQLAFSLNGSFLEKRNIVIPSSMPVGLGGLITEEDD